MSIPERLYRIAKYKLTEFKDRLDELDEESLREAEIRRSARSDARQELDTAEVRTPTGRPAPDMPLNAPRPRTPEEIARGMRPGSNLSAPPPTTTVTTVPTSPQSDPLLYHYRLLGVESGADFTEVQTAYNRYVARLDPVRFPAGSEEATQALQLRERLDASFKVLREALDSTTKRFDLLEFDSPAPPKME